VRKGKGAVTVPSIGALPVRRAQLALLLPALLLALLGCRQPEEANDNGPQEQPVRPPSVFREPVPVESPPLTVDQPEGPKVDESPSSE